MKAKHTPGPWVIKRGDDGRLYIFEQSEVNDFHPLAKCYRNGFDGEANVSLIAAAPDLLDACRAALLQLNGDRPELIGMTKVMLEEAIAKAEGEEL